MRPAQHEEAWGQDDAWLGRRRFPCALLGTLDGDGAAESDAGAGLRAYLQACGPPPPPLSRHRGKRKETRETKSRRPSAYMQVAACIDSNEHCTAWAGEAIRIG